MRRIIAVACISLCALFPQTVTADDVTGRLGIFGNFGAALPVGPEFVGTASNEGWALGGGIRYGLNKHWGVAASYDDVRVSDGVQFRPVNLMASYAFRPDSRLTPIVFAGIGVAAVASDDNYNNLSGKVSGGLEYFILRSLSVSGLVSYHIVNKNGSSTEVLQAATGGLKLTWWFDIAKGYEQAAASAKAEATQAAAPVQQAVQARLDTDNDGVTDDLDKCPGTASGTAVGADGCPLPPAAPADPLAGKIEAGQTVSVEIKVLFDTGKALVKPEYDGEIKKIADFMRKYPETKAEIQGHSDNVGDPARNRQLSQRRAASVREALVSKFGIAGDRLTAAGYGDAQPLAPNDSAANRARNRRVMASITAAAQ